MTESNSLYRIAILAETFPPDTGGIAVAHEALARLLEPHHEVARFAFWDPRPSLPAARLFRSKELGPSNRILAWLANRFVQRHDSTGRAAMTREIAETIPASLALSRQLSRFDPDFVLVSDHRLPGLALRKPPGSRFIWMAHHNYARFQSQPLLPYSGWYDPFFANRLERRAVAKADFAIFPSRYMEGVFRETLCPELPGVIIPNAIDLEPIRRIDRIEARETLGLSAESILVGIPSGGTIAKGERYVFEIVRRLASRPEEVNFLVTGPLGGGLASELDALPPSVRVHRPGKVAHEENLRNIAACDLLVSPTLVENFSCALLEAQAMGIPVVTFDVGGNREIVADGATGYVVPLLDLEALLERAGELVTTPAARQRFGDSARRRVESMMQATSIRERYEEVFRSLLVPAVGSGINA